MRAGQIVGFLCLAFVAPVLAAPEVAKKSDSFVDSIGVNSHFGNSIYTGGNAYADPRIQTELGALGVRHIRDHSWNDSAFPIVDSLNATYGVKANLILGETTRSPAELQALL